MCFWIAALIQFGSIVTKFELFFFAGAGAGAVSSYSFNFYLGEMTGFAAAGAFTCTLAAGHFTTGAAADDPDPDASLPHSNVL